MTIQKKVVLAIALALAGQLVAAQGAATKADAETRAESILGKMTVEEKIDMIGGINDFFTRPIPRLGVPALKMSDGYGSGLSKRLGR
jgi:beta-glucosidase